MPKLAFFGFCFAKKPNVCINQCELVRIFQIVRNLLVRIAKFLRVSAEFIKANLIQICTNECRVLLFSTLLFSHFFIPSRQINSAHCFTAFLVTNTKQSIVQCARCISNRQQSENNCEFQKSSSKGVLQKKCSWKFLKILLKTTVPKPLF